MATSSLLMGSYRAMPDQTMTFGGGAETVAGSTTYGDSIYLRDDTTAALSLLDQVGTAIANKEAGGAAVLQENGKIKLSATGTFTVTWTTTLLRDLLGFNSNLSGANSYEAPNLSPIVWIPGTTESPGGAVLGLVGANHYDAVRVQAPSNRQVVRTFGTPVQRNSFSWSYIPQAYYETTGTNGGELVRFFNEVLVIGAKFRLYRNITFDTTSSSTMTLPAGLGPYEMEEDHRSMPFRRGKGFERVEKAYDFSMRVLVVDEYS